MVKAASNARIRMQQAAFPVSKTLAEFDLAGSSTHRARRWPTELS
jgi:hypothetical protein